MIITKSKSRRITRCSIKRVLILLLGIVIWFYYYVATTVHRQQQQQDIVTSLSSRPITTTSQKRIQKLQPFDGYYVTNKWDIQHNINFLLDFAIVAFPKCGTSTLMLYLENQTHLVDMQHHERCEFGYNQHGK